MQLEQKVDGKVGIRIAIAIQATDSLLFKDYDSLSYHQYHFA